MNKFKVRDEVIVTYQRGTANEDNSLGYIRTVTKAGDQYVVVPFDPSPDADPSDANPIDLFDEEDLTPVLGNDLQARQVAHIKARQEAFDQLHGGHRDVGDYFHDYSYIPDLYQRVCDDLGIEPKVG